MAFYRIIKERISEALEGDVSQRIYEGETDLKTPQRSSRKSEGEEAR